MESIQAYNIQYDSVKDNKYYNEKDKERRLEKHFNNIQADDTLEISQALEASVKESLARKQDLKDERVSIDKTWLKVAERKGYLKISLLKHRQHEVIQKFGVDNNLQEKLEKHNIRYQTFLVRVNVLGWSIERAYTTPPKNQNTKRFLKMYPHRAWEILNQNKGNKCK